MRDYIYRRTSEFGFIFSDAIREILEPENATNFPYMLSTWRLLKARREQKNDLGSDQ